MSQSITLYERNIDDRLWSVSKLTDHDKFIIMCEDQLSVVLSAICLPFFCDIQAMTAFDRSMDITL